MLYDKKVGFLLRLISLLSIFLVLFLNMFVGETNGKNDICCAYHGMKKVDNMDCIFQRLRREFSIFDQFHELNAFMLLVPIHNFYPA